MRSFLILAGIVGGLAYLWRRNKREYERSTAELEWREQMRREAEGGS